jgi:peptide/nickel transport system substrate-binding protein
MIPSPTAVQKAGAAYGTSTPVGAGPFMVKEWRPGDQMVLERNPNYFIKGQPYLDTVIHKLVPDEQQRNNTLRAGQADIYNGSPAGAALIVAAVDQGFKLDAQTLDGGSAYMLNTTRPPLNDPKVRRALALGVDFQQLQDVVNAGQSGVVDTLFRKESPLYSNIKLPSGTYKPKEAQKLINEWSAANGGKPVEITLTGIIGSGTPGSTFADFMQSSLNRLANMKVSVQYIDLPSSLTACAQHTLDANPVGNAFYDPVAMRDRLHSTAVTNCGAYSNPEMDAALDALKTSTKPADRKEAAETVQRLLAKDVPIVYFQRAWQPLVFNKSVKGIEQNGPWTLNWGKVWKKA